MSVLSLALRVILARMLKDRTWAGSSIVDSPVNPLAEVLEARTADAQGQRPVIAIYTGEVSSDPEGRYTQGGPQTIKLNVWVYLPPARFETGEEIVYEWDNTGAGLALDTIGRQIQRAMHFGNAPWVAIWNRLVGKVVDWKARFVLVQIEKGVDVPCVEIAVTLSCVAEPDYGTPLFGAWVDLDASLRASGGAESVALADHIKALIETPDDIPEWQNYQGQFGLTDAAMAAIGLKPLVTDDDGDAVTFDEHQVTFDQSPIVPGDEDDQ